MAASMRAIGSYLPKFKASFKGCCLCSCRAFGLTTIRAEQKKPSVGLTPDGSMLVCWHPEPEFPYEHTKPLPRNIEELKEAESPLKIQVLKQYETRHRPDGPNIHELANLTFTTKHRWYPQPEKKYRKRNPPKEREGI